MAEKHVLKKAITLQAKSRKQAGGSKQIPPDPFGRLYSEYGLVKPPYDFNHLMELKESNPIHAACIEAKADDIAGLGWQWVTDDNKKGNDSKRDAVESVLSNCNPEFTFREILRAVWEDYETIGWGVMEIVTDGKGQVAEVYHMPGATVRAHKDGVLFAQYREGIVRFFKRYGDENNYDMDNGNKANNIEENKQAGSVIVIRKAGGRSSYYGIPTYIASLGALVGSIQARDFNIDYFTSGGMPDSLLIVAGGDVAPEVSDTLKGFFNHEAKNAGRSKLAILPVPAESEGVQVKVEKLTPEVKDASFRLYKQDNALEICVAHRVPPYRIGWPITGSLGGSTSEEMNEFYKASVVEPGQATLEHRLNTFLFAPFEMGEWKWKLKQIDTTDRGKDLEYATKGVAGGLMTVDEGRKEIGMEPVEDKETGKLMFRPTSWTKLTAEEPEPPQETPPIPPGTETPPEPPPGPPQPQEGQEPPNNMPPKPEDVQKEEELEKGDKYWTHWIKPHHEREVSTQKALEDFSQPKPSE